MSGWVNIVCPACASPIKIPGDRIIAACSQCGTELVIRAAGDSVSLAPVAEALRGLENGSPPSDAPEGWSQAHARSEILELLSEIDQLWLERRHDLATSLRLLIIAGSSLVIMALVDVGWLRCLTALIALIGLPGLYGLYDYFIGKSKEARRQRLEQALIAIWPVLEQSTASDTSPRASA